MGERSERKACPTNWIIFGGLAVGMTCMCVGVSKMGGVEFVKVPMLDESGNGRELIGILNSGNDKAGWYLDVMEDAELPGLGDGGCALVYKERLFLGVVCDIKPEDIPMPTQKNYSKTQP